MEQEFKVGQQYTAFITGCIGTHLVEIVDVNDARYGKPKVKLVETDHFMSGIVLRGDDYGFINK